MTLDDSRAHEKFMRAASTLATSPEDIKQRLYDAAYHVVALQPEELPETLQTDFITLKRKLTTGPPTAGIGSLRTTIDGLSPTEAAAIAHDIWTFHSYLNEQRYLEIGKRTAG